MLSQILKLRSEVSAIGATDEGVRGTEVDRVRIAKAHDPKVVALLNKAIASNDQCIVESACAVIRSITVTPTEAMILTPALSDNLISALIRFRTTWGLLAVSRLAQHNCSHRYLLGSSTRSEGKIQQPGRRPYEPLLQTLVYMAEAGVPSSGEELVGGRTDLLASVCLGFFSNSLPEAATRVPQRHIQELVNMFATRLKCNISREEEMEYVTCRLLCFGYPLFCRPRFILQGVTDIISNSSLHLQLALKCGLLELVTEILQGEIPNDEHINHPFGDPDSRTVAQRTCNVLQLVS
jgi:hypothetical protein